MTQFRNTPALTNQQGIGQKKVYSHQPITLEHFGIQAAICENGTVRIRSAPTPVSGSKDEVEYDEVTIPASLVFKLAMFLKETRKIEYVDSAPVVENK